MLGTVEAAFTAALAAAAGTWPVRWPNDPWPDGIAISDGNMPLDVDGRPAPAIEAEIIAGTPATLGIGKASDGMRTQRLDGIARFYLSVGLGTGRAGIVAMADVLVDAFTRATLVDGLTTEDARIDDGAAAYEEGNRYARMVTVPFTYLFKAAQK